MDIEIHSDDDKKIVDEMHFLIKYLSELDDEGFSKQEIFYILASCSGSLLECMRIEDQNRVKFYEFIEICFQKNRSHRIKTGNLEEK